MKSDSEQSVIAVEAKLTKLDTMSTNIDELNAMAERPKQDEAQLLASDDKTAIRTKKLVALRAEQDVVQADLDKAKAEYFACRAEVISLAISAHDKLCAWREQIIESRSAVIRGELEKLFDKQAMTEVGRFVRFSRPVRELDVVRLVFVSAKPELGLSNARKVRSILSDLQAAAQNKPLPSSLVAPGRSESPELVQLVPEPAGNQLGVLL